MRQLPEPTPSWRTMLQLVRAPAIFTAISNILAAHLIATGGSIQWRSLVLLCGASVFLYAAGMVLNDCFDYAEDARERPQRPLPSGRVSLQAAWASGWFLLAGGVALASIVGQVQMFIAGVLAVAIVAYDGLLKHTPSGAYAMGACRYLNWLLGLSVSGITAQSFLIALPVFVYVASLTLLAADEARAANRQVLGRSATGLLLTALCVTALIVNGILPGKLAFLPMAAGLVFLLHRLTQTSHSYSPESVQSMVMVLIFGIIPLDALLVLAAGSPWGMLAVVALMIPGRLLARAIYVT